MAIATFKRYELKFLLTKTQFCAMTAALPEYMNIDGYCENGSWYGIHNLYYDTPNSDYIRESLSKPYYKEKLRLRCYNPTPSPEEKVFLEVKKKTGGIVYKRRAVMTLKEAYAFTGKGILPAVTDYMNTQVINELAYLLSCAPVAPAAYISYRRLAYFGKEDNELRVTFDKDITTRRNELNLESGSYGTPLLQKGRYLMEIKTEGNLPYWLAELLSELEIYKTSFSKYGAEYRRLCQSRAAQHPLAPAAISVVSYPNIFTPSGVSCLGLETNR
ncbi:polyphosphate polymerase domain-containing protein [Acetanaerobacterium elongatum]|uniref:VTC domain-containing protein n=1 Tax=Acetanaerobacterium elongatum TaxID=258515 RepID=A0A1G9U4M9_9FIRM|nr:polyphosphate polymerase domain-containing protein [Acetanaerobacterium elongatum]SDM54848.1 VTC domain-containing protein [Acetanaerobacterium elongatum]